MDLLCDGFMVLWFRCAMVLKYKIEKREMDESISLFFIVV